MTQVEREQMMFGVSKDEILESMCNAELRGIRKVDMAISMLSDLQEEMNFSTKLKLNQKVNVIKYILMVAKDEGQQ